MNTTLISDIDGTLLWRSDSVTSNVRDSIALFNSHQYFFSICTGRALQGCTQILNSLSDFVNCPSIFLGGALIWDPKRQKEIACTYCDNSIIDVISQINRRYPSISITINTKEEIGTLRMNEILKTKGTLYDRSAPFIPMHDLKKKKILKVLLTSDEPIIIEEIKNELLDPQVFHATFASTHFFEITDNSVNKGNAIACIKNRYTEIQNTEIWAAGDSLSDISMKDHVSKFACPSDARPEVYAIADYVFPSPKESGITQLIHHILEENHDI